MADYSEKELEELKAAALAKKEILENIYDITARREFLGEESEIDDFIAYLDMREPYYEQLAEHHKNVGAKLNGFKADFSSKNRLYRDVSQAITNAQDVADKIVELDKKNNENMGRLHKKLMSEVKNISVSKKARSSYNFFQVQSGGEYEGL